MNLTLVIRQFVPVLLSATLLVNCSQQESNSSQVTEDPATTLVAQANALMAPLVSAGLFSGAVVLTQQGNAVYQQGFGMANHEEGFQFTVDTPSDGASLAKNFTAAGIWWLVQEGRINLDAPVTDYLPTYPHAQTTVRQVFTHSNGLPPYYEFFDPFFASDELRTTQSMLRVVAEQAPEPFFTPGARFEYSNLGFDVAAEIIESISGMSYEDFLRERIFSRLGMLTTFVRPARFAEWSGVRTRAYRWRDNGWEDVEVFDNEAFYGGSNIYFSAADLSRWASANAAATAIPENVFALGQQHPLIAGQSSPITGLSWYCAADGLRCYYTGSLNAFHALVHWDRQRNDSVVFVSNSAMPAWQTITLQRNLVALLTGEGTSLDASESFIAIESSAYASLAGSYRDDRNEEITLLTDNNSLRLREGSGLEFDVFPVSDTEYYVPGSDFWLAFSGEGPAPTLHLRSMFVDRVMQKSNIWLNDSR